MGSKSGVRVVVDHATVELINGRFDFTITSGDRTWTTSYTPHQLTRINREVGHMLANFYATQARLDCMEHCTKHR